MNADVPDPHVPDLEDPVVPDLTGIEEGTSEPEDAGVEHGASPEEVLALLDEDEG